MEREEEENQIKMRIIKEATGIDLKQRIIGVMSSWKILNLWASMAKRMPKNEEIKNPKTMDNKEEPMDIQKAPSCISR